MALSTIKLTESGDIEMNTLNQTVTLLARDAIEQKIVAAFSLWKNNWYRNPLRGVDWLRVFKKKYTRREIIQVLTQAIVQVEAVTKVIDIYVQVDNSTRQATIQYIVEANQEIVNGSVAL